MPVYLCRERNQDGDQTGGREPVVPRDGDDQRNPVLNRVLPGRLNSRRDTRAGVYQGLIKGARLFREVKRALVEESRRIEPGDSSKAGQVTRTNRQGTLQPKKGERCAGARQFPHVAVRKGYATSEKIASTALPKVAKEISSANNAEAIREPVLTGIGMAAAPTRMFRTRETATGLVTTVLREYELELPLHSAAATTACPRLAAGGLGYAGTKQQTTAEITQRKASP